MGYGLLRLLDDDLCVIASLFLLVSLYFIETSACLLLKRQCFMCLTPASSVPRNSASQTCSSSNVCTSINSKSQQCFEYCKILRVCTGSFRSASSQFPSVLKDSHNPYSLTHQAGTQEQIVCVKLIISLHLYCHTLS